MRAVCAEEAQPVPTRGTDRGMDKTSKDQYGRKKWNLEAYEDEARRGTKRKDVSDEAKKAAASYDESVLQHRANLIDQSVLAVNKHTLISGENNTSAVYGKNKRFGFSCPVCDLSFRDTLALVDHINSPQHANNAQRIARQAGQGGSEVATVDGITRATPQEVSMTIERLVAAAVRERTKSSELESIHERIKKRQEFMERLSAKRRKKRQLKKRKVSEGTSGGGGGDDEIMQLMGFGGFKTTKS